MKILNCKQIREADAYTIKNEHNTSINLMERASKAFTNKFTVYFDELHTIHVFCGIGNNGGDGLAVSRILLKQSYKVKTYIVRFSENYSDDFKINLGRLKKCKNQKIIFIDDENFEFAPAENDIVIDALWGTGLTRPIAGFATSVIEKINNSKCTVVALDIPSGLFCDEINTDKNIIRAGYTFTFQFPKFSFFMPENEKYVGKFEVLDIGISREFISSIEVNYFFSRENNVKKLLKNRNIFTHKGDLGHALIISGSYGKIGAAVLVSKSCLRCGVGLVTTYLPACGYIIIQTAIPEVMVITDNENNFITGIPDISPYQAIGIGPGIGQDPQTAKALKKLFTDCKNPLVIDADGINLISSDEELKTLIPQGSILTPHIGEFDRLAGKSTSQYERLGKLRDLSMKYNCNIVLKGAYSAIANAEGKIFFNSTGNPGMATAGSGDVLTGIITSFLAQGYKPDVAAITGVFIHGLAGDLAAKKHSQPAMISEDIIEMLGEAFMNITG